MKNSSIDINQRIPLFILEVGLQSFLEGTYSNEYIQEQLALEYSGENRIKKGLRIVNKIINDHNGKLNFVSVPNGAKVEIIFY